MFTTFEEYQAQYESRFLPYPLYKKLKSGQAGFHRLVEVIDASLAIPSLITKIIHLSLTLLSFFPTIKPVLAMPEKVCKDAKNLMHFFKGFKAVDGLLNLKSSWRLIALNVAGITLFVITIISLADRFRLFNVSTIKVMLAALPISGVLPFGGFLPLALLSIASVVMLIALETKRKLEQKVQDIQERKLAFWSSSVDFSKVQAKQAKYDAKIETLQTDILLHEDLLQEGLQVEEELSQQTEQTYSLEACQKALKELTQSLEKKKDVLEKYQTKNEQWMLLEKQWDKIDSQEIENFREAKETKWRGKIDKLERKQRVKMLSIANSLMGIAKQMLLIATTLSGYGIALSVLMNVGLEIAGTGCEIKKYFANRTIKELKISPIDLDHYIHFEENNDLQ